MQKLTRLHFHFSMGASFDYEVEPPDCIVVSANMASSCKRVIEGIQRTLQKEFVDPEEVIRMIFV